MIIYLCDKVLEGDVPNYEFDDKDIALYYINGWLNTKDFKTSVFACFNSFRNEDGYDFRDEHSSILVSHSLNVIRSFINSVFMSVEKVDFSIFEFDSYEDAFDYCTDLKEGF